MEYLEKKRDSPTFILLSNGDTVHKGGDRTAFEGQWFFYRKSTKYTQRLPHATTYEEALEEYQTETGNCIV
jgi:hypothetical protein